MLIQIFMNFWHLICSLSKKRIVREESGKFFVDEGMSIILAILAFGLIIAVIAIFLPDFFETIFSSAQDTLTNSPKT